VRSKWGKLVAVLLAIAVVASLAVGCAAKPAETPAPAETPKTDVKAAMVTDTAGLGDKSFNDLAWSGFDQAKTEFGVQTKALQSMQPADYEKNLVDGATAGYNPVVAVGFLLGDTVKKVAPQYPDTVFVGIDQFFDPTIPNVIGVTFKEQDAAYLAGVLAGNLTSMTDVDSRINDQLTVGFVGGMSSVPPVVRFYLGYEAGAKKANPNIKVLKAYTEDFEDQLKGKEAALAQIEQGADIIFAAAGKAGIGAFDACKEKNKLFIGVDSDQFLTLSNPGDVIVTSAIKKVDVPAYEAIKLQVDGTLKGGENRQYGLVEDAVGLAPYHDWDTKLPQSVKDAVDAARTEVVEGTVVVPSE